MPKIHLRRNKNPEVAAVAACATNPHVLPRSAGYRNGRTTYQTMASTIVGFAAFCALPASDRCTHCCDAALAIRNRQRAANGKPAVTVWNEGI